MSLEIYKFQYMFVIILVKSVNKNFQQENFFFEFHKNQDVKDIYNFNLYLIYLVTNIFHRGIVFAVLIAINPNYYC